MQDLYAILGVGRDSSNAAIKAAYRELAKQSHPDLHVGDGEAENRTKEINYAYTILGDPSLRAAYDDELDTLSAKERKVAFMNVTAVAAGIAFFAIAAGVLAYTVTRLHSADRHQQTAEARRLGQTQIATVGVPESAIERSPVAAAEVPQAGSVLEDPAHAAGAEQAEAPVQETEHAALAVAPRPEIGAAPAAAQEAVVASANAKAQVEPEQHAAAPVTAATEVAAAAGAIETALAGPEQHARRSRVRRAANGGGGRGSHGAYGKGGRFKRPGARRA